MKTFGLLAVVSLAGIAQAWADQLPSRSESSQRTRTALLLSHPGRPVTPIPIHSSWQFLGCVYAPRECHHVAHDSGYIDFTARHDHYTCHHGPSFACYGR